METLVANLGVQWKTFNFFDVSEVNLSENEEIKSAFDVSHPVFGLGASMLTL